ncbi:uncharacterized protein LOC106650066 [Trichogramma pretiosum]|uniref:uncharacterized protein LOC106650066 n=1 Tax=Trichogramma pretiosum TaxID=7493 RepID=UPI0006C982E5|nr:uncharacterized protein LOC106650066 [Trichogramma pretiosum]
MQFAAIFIIAYLCVSFSSAAPLGSEADFNFNAGSSTSDSIDPQKNYNEEPQDSSEPFRMSLGPSSDKSTDCKSESFLLKVTPASCHQPEKRQIANETPNVGGILALGNDSNKKMRFIVEIQHLEDVAPDKIDTERIEEKSVEVVTKKYSGDDESVETKTEIPEDHDQPIVTDESTSETPAIDSIKAVASHNIKLEGLQPLVENLQRIFDDMLTCLSKNKNSETSEENSEQK